MDSALVAALIMLIATLGGIVMKAGFATKTDLIKAIESHKASCAELIKADLNRGHDRFKEIEVELNDIKKILQQLSTNVALLAAEINRSNGK